MPAFNRIFKRGNSGILFIYILPSPDYHVKQCPFFTQGSSMTGLHDTYLPLYSQLPFLGKYEHRSKAVKASMDAGNFLSH